MTEESHIEYNSMRAREGSTLPSPRLWHASGGGGGRKATYLQMNIQVTALIPKKLLAYQTVELTEATRVRHRNRQCDKATATLPFLLPQTM